MSKKKKPPNYSKFIDNECFLIFNPAPPESSSETLEDGTVAYYSDDYGNPVEKAKATRIEIIESDGTRTYGSIEPQQR